MSQGGSFGAGGGGGGGGTFIPFTDVVTSTQQMVVNHGYTTDDGATLVTLTLPALAAYGSTMMVVGKASGLWKVVQNAGQIIHFGNQNTTSGVTGYLSSLSQYDYVWLLCTAANTDFTVIGSSAQLTYN